MEDARLALKAVSRMGYIDIQLDTPSNGNVWVVIDDSQWVPEEEAKALVAFLKLIEEDE